MSANPPDPATTASGKVVAVELALAPATASDAHEVAAPGESVSVPLAPKTGSISAVTTSNIVAAEAKPWWKSISIWVLTSGTAVEIASALSPQLQAFLPPRTAHAIAAVLMAFVAFRRSFDNSVIR